MRVRHASRLVAAGAAIVLLLAACGGGAGGATDPAMVLPPNSPVAIEGPIRTEGRLKTELEAVERVAGAAGLGARLVPAVEPWLGERGVLGFERFDGHEFTGSVIGLQTTDPGATEDFLRRRAREEPGGREGSYEGVDFWVERDGGQTVGVTAGLLVLAESEAVFKRAVDAATGESLADQERFTEAMATAPSGGLADVYVDVGGLVRQSGGAIGPEQKLALEFAGIDLKEATAVASISPGSDRVEVDVSTDLAGKQSSSGDASKLLGSVPAGAPIALAAPEYGKALREGIEQIDAGGIPGQVPPHRFKQVLGEAGIDVEAIAGSIGDVAVFVEGVSESTLGGAVVAETKSASEAENTVANVGLLVRASGATGVTALDGRVSGFSVRGAGIGGKPIVVAARGNRIAISNGLPSAILALATESGPKLGETATFKEAAAALGSTPISGFAAGPPALRLASSLIGSDRIFRAAKPYLRRIAWLALGAAGSGGPAGAKLIVGLRR